MQQQKAVKLAERYGFSHAGIFQVSDMKFREEVRKMCADGRCARYGHCWSCPPACGTLEESRRRAAAFDWGLLLQTTGQMEDPFDWECMKKTERIQKKKFLELCSYLHRAEERILPMSAGSCTLCGTCTYPQSPCRFPERMCSSMEAYGLLVSETCEAAGIPYYYGENTITYHSCILFCSDDATENTDISGTKQ